MRLVRYLIISILLIGFGTLLFAAEPARTAIKPAVKRAPVKIVKATLNKDVLIAAGTGVQGTIKFSGALPGALSGMKCSDVNVLVGAYKTPAAAPGTIAITTFEEIASSTATGEIASKSCSYAVRGVPTATPYSVLVVGYPNPAHYHCDQVSFDSTPSQPKLVFKPGQMQTQNFTVTPYCTVVK